MFPSPKSSPIGQETAFGQVILSPEICDFCRGKKLPSPSRHFCTVPVNNLSEGRIHPVTKQLICSLVTCGECQSTDNNSPNNVCLKHWLQKNASSAAVTDGASVMYKDRDADKLPPAKPRSNGGATETNNGKENMANENVVRRYVDWDEVRDDPTCYIDDKVWINLVQDKGVHREGHRCTKGYRRARDKASRSGQSAVQYKELNDLATILFNLYKSKPEYFDIKLRRHTDGIATIMGWIVDKRDRDLISVKSLTLDNVPSDDIYVEIMSWKKKGDDFVYLIDQRSILLEAFSVWGRKVDKVKGNGPNDYVRLVAVLLHHDNRDSMDIINDNVKTRTDLDDPSRSKSFIFDQLAIQFASDTVYSHPKRWEKIAEENLENKTLVNPNDPNYRRKNWSGSELKHMYDFVIKRYKDIMAKWTKGTGGGPGAPENYENWETRDDELFENYTGAIESIPWLTWIYTSDQENGGLLLSKYEGLPASVSTEEETTRKKKSYGGDKRLKVLTDFFGKALKDLKDDLTNMHREGLAYTLHDQFEKAREEYITLTMAIIDSGAELHRFQLNSMKRKRNDSYRMMKKLKLDLENYGILKDIEEFPDDDLPY